MKKPLLAFFLIFALIPISSSYSQEFTDSEQKYGLVLSLSQYSFQDEDGKTVVLGEVENKNNHPVSGIKIRGDFFDKFGNRLEFTIGTTIMKVISPSGKSPFMIKSETSNSAIVDASASLLGFNSSAEKKQQLNLQLDTLKIGEKLSLSGTITNNGELNSTSTKIQFISYDAFTRVLRIATVDLENDITPGGTENFEFDVKPTCIAGSKSFKIFGESQDYTTGLIDITDISFQVLNKLVTINNMTVTDSDGNKLSDVSVGSSINIQSELDFQEPCREESQVQQFVYWIQIKKSEVDEQKNTKSFVHFIGKVEGSFISAGQQIPSVEWIPQENGLYFVETFVWDPKNTPLASKGPISLILVQ